MKVHIGFDIGSTFTKVCIMDMNGQIESLSTFPTPLSQKEYFNNFVDELKSQYDIKKIAACGYGRENIMADITIAELVALAKGAHYVTPKAEMLLDIGGQDSKMIQCKKGKLMRFFLNDKCAAGSGLFLQNTLRILNISFNDLIITSQSITPLSTVCAVFAQTEIIRCISNGNTAKELSESVIYSILKQAAGMVKQINKYETLAFTGGMALISGAGKLLSSIINAEVIVPEHCNYLASIGCAILSI